MPEFLNYSMQRKKPDYLRNKEQNWEVALNLNLLSKIEANFFFNAAIEYSKIRFLLSERTTFNDI